MNAFRTNLLASAAMATLVFAGAAHGQIVLDGRLGPAGAITPVGGNYAITNTIGTQVGGNLFHSFTTFNLATSNVATFSGNPGTANIVARVTGGSGSSIDGTMRSTIAGANLWFINPWGVTFGPNAQLDVSGAFHASTASYLTLGSGPGAGRFDAANPNASNLVAAAPSAFGFLGTPAPLSVQGATLQVPDGETLTLAGGKLTLNAATLKAHGGRINLASAGSAGEIALGAGVAPSAGMTLGEISMTGGLVTTESPTGSATDSGPIFIRAGKLTLQDDAKIRAWISPASTSTGNGGDIDIAVSGDLTMVGSDIEAGIFNDSPGSPGDIAISAGGSMLVTGGSRIRTVNVFGSAGSGNLSLTAGRLTVDNGLVTASTGGDGNGGAILVNVGDLYLLNRGIIRTASIFDGNLMPNGNAGNITVNATGSVVISGAGSGLFTTANGHGDGGVIKVSAAADIRVLGGGTVSASSDDPDADSGNPPTIFSPQANSGSIELSARGSVIIDGGSVTTFSEAASAGPITINAIDKVVIRDGSVTTATTSARLADTAGSITIDPVFVILDNGILRTSGGVADGGPVTITTQFFMMAPDSVLDTSSTFGQAGRVTINSPNQDTVSELGTLPAGYFDASALLRESCAARAGRGANSFVGAGRGGLPAGPGALAFANYAIPAAATAAAPQPLLYASLPSACVR